jgi:hypothetical protein
MFPCSHGNIFFSTKWERSQKIKKKVVYIRGDTRAFS